MQFHFLWPDPGHCVKYNFTQCFANAIVFTLVLCVFSLSFARLSLFTLAFLFCFGIFSLHFYRPYLCLGIFMSVRISVFFFVHDNISIGELAPLARVFTVFVQLSAHNVFLFTYARAKDCCRFVAAVKNDLVTKMLVNMSIYSSVNYMHEPKQTHQFQCTMPMIIGLMEMNRTPMTQRIITLNLLLTKLNQFALSLLLCASVCVFFLFRCFWKIRFNANTVFNRFFVLHYCCFCCYFGACFDAMALLIPIWIVLRLVVFLGRYSILWKAILILVNENFGPNENCMAARFCNCDVKWRFKWIERYSN